MSNTQDLKRVLDKKQSILQGDADRIAKQRAAGKRTARERVAMLLDQGSFVETDALVSKNGKQAGVVTGFGTVQDRPVYLFAQDFTVDGGAMGEAQADKILKVLEMARKTGAPVVALCDSNGVRLQEGAAAMNAYSRVYTALARMSGVCPIVAVVLGPAIGGAAYLTQLADISIMAEKTGSVSVYSAQVMGAKDDAAVGGAKVMTAQGGAALTAPDEESALALAAQVLDLLPGSNAEDAPLVEDGDDLNRLLSEMKNAGDVLASLPDGGSCVELYAGYGRELRTALCRMGGRSVGLVVSDKSVNNGCLTADSASKAARFIRLCDCYSIPVVTMIDSCGVVRTAIADQADLIKGVSRLIYAYAEATCAKVSVVTGNAIGQSFIALAGKGNADVTYAWPGAVISALTPEAAAVVLVDENKKAGRSVAETAAEYAAETADAMNAAAAGLIDDVVEPAETRKLILAAIEMLASKRDANPPKKHGNLPL